MLEISSLDSGYGDTQVLFSLDLSAREGEVTALLGRNGAGKSTTLKTVMGLLPVRAGTITFDGAPLAGLSPHAIAHRGIAYVPETRDIFKSLSVRENLELAARISPPSRTTWTLESVMQLFPRLGERLDNGGNQLSGGEQQMLAIARGLLMNPRLLILDEPTEGLAPIIVKQIGDALLSLKSSGLSILLVEQKLRFAARLADHVTVLGRGAAVWYGNGDELLQDVDTKSRWLGV